MTGCGDDSIDGLCGEALGGLDSCVKLAGDASTREYYRAIFRGKTVIASRDPSFVDVPLESYPYYQVYTLFLKHRIPVPHVMRFDPPRGLLLIEDAGDLLLEDLAVSAGLDGARPYYERLIDILVDIQGVPRDGSIPFTLSFDLEKLMFEFNFFTEHTLRGFFGARMSQPVQNELERAFLRVSESLQRPDLFVLNHRDYHSRNVLVRDGEIFVIDFQDARLGLPQYDLVSLLRDSYVGLGDAPFSDLKRRYYDASRERGVQSMGAGEFERYFDLSAFQRNVKALGTYGYQSVRRGNHLYVKYIRRALDYLPGYAERHGELREATRIILGIAGEAR